MPSAHVWQSFQLLIVEVKQRWLANGRDRELKKIEEEDKRYGWRSEEDFFFNNIIPSRLHMHHGPYWMILMNKARSIMHYYNCFPIATWSGFLALTIFLYIIMFRILLQSIFNQTSFYFICFKIAVAHFTPC
ncbi:hypothetical protein ACJX0J_028020, partial [Zea mays]